MTSGTRGLGVLDGARLRDALYRENIICAPSIVIRRSLFEKLGPFVEDFGADDLEYWMRCLRDGAVFHYDPRVLLRYRRHDSNLSSRLLWMAECSHDVHRWYAADIADPVLRTSVLAEDPLQDRSLPRGRGASPRGPRRLPSLRCGTGARRARSRGRSS